VGTLNKINTDNVAYLSLTVSQQGQSKISVSQMTDERDETWSPAETLVGRRRPWLSGGRLFHARNEATGNVRSL